MEVDFSKILGSFAETSHHRKNSIPAASAASERSERSERSDSGVRTHILQDFCEDSRKAPKRTRHHRKNVNNNTRFPFPYLLRQVYVEWFFAPKTSPRRSKTAQSGPRRPKTGQRRPKRPPRRAKTRPRRPQDAPRGVQDTILVGLRSQNGAKLAPK